MNKKTIITALLFITAITANAQLLFRISGNSLNAPSYVVGTYHLVDDSFVDSIPGLRQAFADCQQVYTEVLKSEMTSEDSLAFKKVQLLPKGMTIDKLLSSEEMNRLNAYVKKIIGADLSNPRLGVPQDIGGVEGEIDRQHVNEYDKSRPADRLSSVGGAGFVWQKRYSASESGFCRLQKRHSTPETDFRHMTGATLYP